jgi:hypothetical protein
VPEEKSKRLSDVNANDRAHEKADEETEGRYRYD